MFPDVKRTTRELYDVHLLGQEKPVVRTKFLTFGMQGRGGADGNRSWVDGGHVVLETVSERARPILLCTTLGYSSGHLPCLGRYSFLLSAYGYYHPGV